MPRRLLLGTFTALVLVALSACGSAAPIATAPAPQPPASAHATSPTSSAPLTQAAPLKVGATIVANDRQTIFYPGQGAFAMVNPGASSSGRLTVYDSVTGQRFTQAPRAVGTDWTCGFTVVSNPEGRKIVLGEKNEVTQAEGLQPGAIVRHLLAFDAVTLKQLWDAEVWQKPNTDPNASPTNACFGDAAALDITLSATIDGRWALSRIGGQASLVEIATGKVSTLDGGLTTVGTWIAVGHDLNGLDLPTSVTLVDPATGAVVGSSSDTQAVAALRAGLLGARGGSMAVSHDGTVGVVNEDGLAAFTLPALHRLWTKPQTGSGLFQVLVDSTGAVDFPDPANRGYQPTIAVDVATGQQTWSLDTAKMCSARAGTAAVIANHQLVLVSSVDGSQQAFDTTVDDCPTDLGGALELDSKVVSLGSW